MTTLEHISPIDSQGFEPIIFEPYPGFTAEIVSKSDTQVAEALMLESDVMKMLGDDGVKEDIANTFDDSGFIVIKNEGVVSGAIRFMLPEKGKNKTFIDVAADTGRELTDVENLFLAQSERIGGVSVSPCVDLGALIDASALSPVLTDPSKIARYSDALLAACRVVGTVLYDEGDSTHVTGNLHGIFISHAKRIGYEFERLKDENGELITSFRGNRTDFLPVFTSLELYKDLMMNARPNSHLGKVNTQYNNLSPSDRKAIAAAMNASAKGK